MTARCAAEKILLTTDFIIFVLLMYQLVFVYRQHSKLNCKDQRIQILMFSAFSSFYVFMHYGIIPRRYRAMFFVYIEFFRLFILYSICYYYCAKASGLLKKRKIVIAFLRILFVLGSILMLVFGMWVYLLIRYRKLSSSLLCTYWQYQFN